MASNHFVRERSLLRILANSGGRSMTSSPRSGAKLDQCTFSCANASAGLHFFIDDEDVALSLCAGDQRGFEGETVDFSGDATALPHGPRFLQVEWHARDDPAQRCAGGFEVGTIGFCDFGVHTLDFTLSCYMIRGFTASQPHPVKEAFRIRSEGIEKSIFEFRRQMPKFGTFLRILRSL